MPFIQQSQLSWVKLETEARPTLPDSLCGSCQNLQNFTKEVLQNFSYLAETGYAEGAICHKLVKGSEEDKKTIAVSIPIIIRSVCNIVCHTFAGAYVDAHLLRSFESEIFKIFTFFGRQRLLSSLRSHQTMVFQIY